MHVGQPPRELSRTEQGDEKVLMCPPEPKVLAPSGVFLLRKEVGVRKD